MIVLKMREKLAFAGFSAQWREHCRAAAARL